MSRGINPLGRARNVLFDLDGCLWFGERVARAAPEIVATLRARGYRVFFLTNASASTVRGLATKLNRLGFPAEPAQVLAPLSVAPLHPAIANGATVLAVGKAVVAQELQAAGVPVTARGEEADVVVVGNDGALTFSDLVPAMLALHRGAALLGLNLDRRVPTESGFAPGTGAIVAALETATGARAQFVGKPSSFYFEQALQRFGVVADECVMVGDSPESDVAGARAAGMATVLVGDAIPDGEQQQPDLPITELALLLHHLRAPQEAACSQSPGRRVARRPRG